MSSGSGGTGDDVGALRRSDIVATAAQWDSFPGLIRLPQLREGRSPYKFQEYAVYRAITQRIFVIALAAGLGKTLCSYLAYMYYRSKFPQTRLLIVTNNTAVNQFVEELDLWFNHDLRTFAVHEDIASRGVSYAQARKAAYFRFGSGDLDVLCLNYPTLRNDLGSLVVRPTHKEPMPDGVTQSVIVAAQDDAIGGAIRNLTAAGIPLFFVADEATGFKTPGIITHDAVGRVASVSSRVLGLTATLTKGRVEEFYGIFSGLGVWLAPNRQWFESQYFIYDFNPNAKHARARWKRVGYKNTAHLVSLLRDVTIVLRKKDVSQYLPRYTPRKVWLRHSAEQTRVCKDIYQGLIGKVREDASSPGELPEDFNPFEAGETLPMQEETGLRTVARLNEMGYLKRALQDPRLVSRENLDDFSLKRASPKTAELIRFLSDEFVYEKVVVYSPSKQYLQLLRATIECVETLPSGYRYPLEITGDVSTTDRDAARKMFQDEQSGRNLILINDAGLEAINLQSGSVLAVLTIPTTGGNLVQLAGRLSRLGSKHTNLLLLYFMHENSQDWDDYLIVQQQLLLMAQTTGEAEEGLVDFDALKQLEKESGRVTVRDDLTPEEFSDLMQQELIFHSRRRRVAFYGAAARGKSEDD